MSATVSAFERLPIRRVAFGIRFQNQFGLEDLLGTVIDDILGGRNFGPDRFENALYSQEQKQLVSQKGDESVTLTRADAIFETKKETFTAEELPKLAEEFIDGVWEAVCNRAPKPPAILRYGSLVTFALPDGWNPIQTIIGQEPADNSEFDLRYTRRLPVEEALAMRDVSDYRTVIFNIQTRKSKSSAGMDVQQYFAPELPSNRARKDQPFMRFVEKAVAYYRTSGWEFLKSRIERLPRAA
jgi:hypothetical protein